MTDVATPVELDYDELVEQLYNLGRNDLRQLAYEALLISDGPDAVGDPTAEDGSMRVTVIHPGGFWIQPVEVVGL